MYKAFIIAVLAVSLPLFWLPYYTKMDTTQITADKLYYGQGKFCVSLFHAIAELRPNETVFFAPDSIYRALLLNYFIAANNRRDQLKKILHLDWLNNEDISRVYELKKLARANCGENQTVEFESVEKLYLSERVELE